MFKPGIIRSPREQRTFELQIEALLAHAPNASDADDASRPVTSCLAATPRRSRSRSAPGVAPRRAGGSGDVVRHGRHEGLRPGGSFDVGDHRAWPKRNGTSIR